MAKGAYAHGNRQNPKGKFDYWSPGDWNFRCDECGIKWKSQFARKRWDNCMVCPLCFEIRNPQDFIKGRPDRPAPPWTRPDPPPVFVGATGSSGTVESTQPTGTLVGGPYMVLDAWLLNSKMLG